ncbi:hypothetical protein ACFLIM_50210 [Nonomuraea sp. M3C6]|uniref:Ig-like domain (Group 3) n=1 Tax=Nonomuraea marmarensis TaxID=3351344 RepID=A0ABW7AV99_9ACTN
MRFSKPFAVTLASVAMIALPLSGAALADGARPKPAATAKAPQPKHSTPANTKDSHGKEVSLSVSVNTDRVRAGDSYSVTIIARGVSSGTATVTSPEGKSYRVSLSGGRAAKTLTVPSKTKAGDKTVSVTVGSKVAEASFTVVSNRRR